LAKTRGIDDVPVRRRFNAAQKRVLKAETVRTFVKQYGRPAQKGIEPNDRRFEREVEQTVRRMKPEDLDALLRDGDD